MKKLYAGMAVMGIAAMATACSGQGAGTTTAAQSVEATTAAESTEAAAEVLTGRGKGFGGEITATVTVVDGVITEVVVVGDQETKGIGSNAIEQLPARIVEAGSTEVDVVTGATVSSHGVIAAVNNALDPVQYPYEEVAETTAEAPEAVEASDAYLGSAVLSSGRVGPGKDDTDTQVYSFNQVYANVVFDGEGKILDLYIDQLEVATPNYDGETMPHFSGFPGQGGYAYDADHDEKVESVTEDTEERFMAEIADWRTKRDRGEGYVMGTGYWGSQMDTYQKIFTGMTVEEVKEWFAKYCSDINGRPLKADSDKPEDVEKFSALSAGEQEMLVDTITGATMSLKDSHGDLIGAIEKAYENRKPIEITKAASMGLGIASSGRVGPGKDDTETPVYSINQVFASTLFDEEGRIAAISIDQLEYATPNYDGETMPHFSGFPGQTAYNYDENHDGKVDGTLEPTEEGFLAEWEQLKTKRERGDGYVMGTGTWSSQMDIYEKAMIGKTVDEVEAWFAAEFSDVNGRPLKADSDKPEDVEKYEKLSDEQKSDLDAISGATMSLKDSHGDIIAAVRKSYEDAKTIDLTIQ